MHLEEFGVCLASPFLYCTAGSEIAQVHLMCCAVNERWLCTYE